jgi:O-antigen ligase
MSKGPDRELVGAGIALGIITAMQFWTQIRAKGSLGGAEILLVAWLVWFAWRNVRNHGRLSRPTVAVLVLLSLTGLMFFWIAITSPAEPWSVSTVGSLGLIAACLVLIDRAGRPKALLNAWMVAFGVTTILSTALVFALPDQLLDAVGVWSLGSRFRGLSNNPNQASASLLIASLCLLLFPLSRLTWLVRGVALLGLYLLLATGSDSGRLALYVGAVLIVSLTVAKRLSVGVALPLALGVAAAAILMSARLMTLFSEYVSEPLRQEADQLGVRQAIWSSCWDFTRENAPLGRGQTVLPVSLGGGECHNLWLDISLAGGLVAMVWVLYLVVVLLRLQWLAPDIAGIAAVGALLVSQFGNSALRFTALWLMLLVLYGRVSPNVKANVPLRLRSRDGVTTEDDRMGKTRLSNRSKRARSRDLIEGLPVAQVEQSR